jgi:hypothetical protein
LLFGTATATTTLLTTLAALLTILATLTPLLATPILILILRHYITSLVWDIPTVIQRYRSLTRSYCSLTCSSLAIIEAMIFKQSGSSEILRQIDEALSANIKQAKDGESARLAGQ